MENLLEQIKVLHEMKPTKKAVVIHENYFERFKEICKVEQVTNLKNIKTIFWIPVYKTDNFGLYITGLFKDYEDLIVVDQFGCMYEINREQLNKVLNDIADIFRATAVGAKKLAEAFKNTAVKKVETIKPGLIGYDVEEIEDGFLIHNTSDGWTTAKVTAEELEQLKKGELDFIDLNWE